MLSVLSGVWCGIEGTIEKALRPPSQGVQEGVETQRSGDQTAEGWAVLMPCSPSNHRASDTPFRMGDLWEVC